MLSEIEELCSTRPEDYFRVLQKWQQCDITNFNEFQYIEPILTQRSIMYQINDTLCNNSIIKDELVGTHIKIAEIARNQGHLQIAARALGTYRTHNNYQSYHYITYALFFPIRHPSETN